MTTMLERAARAAAEKMRQQDQDAAIKYGCDIHLALDPYLEPARDVARTILMAVRETDRKWAADVCEELCEPELTFNPAPASAFTAMIDAILEGK